MSFALPRWWRRSSLLCVGSCHGKALASESGSPNAIDDYSEQLDYPRKRRGKLSL